MNNQGYRVLCSFHLNAHIIGFHPQNQKLQLYLNVQHNKQYHRKVLLSSFHPNAHIIGFHPQTQKLPPLSLHSKQYHRKVMLSSFHLNGHTLGFHPQTQKGTNLSAFIHIQTDNSITNLKLTSAWLNKCKKIFHNCYLL